MTRNLKHIAFGVLGGCTSSRYVKITTLIIDNYPEYKQQPYYS